MQGQQKIRKGQVLHMSHSPHYPPFFLLAVSRRQLIGNKVISADVGRSKHRLVIFLEGPKLMQRPFKIINKHSLKAGNKKRLHIKVLCASAKERLDSADH